MTTIYVDDEKIALHRTLAKAQLGFDMIVDCLEEGDTEMAMMIASRINLGFTHPVKEKEINNASAL